MARQLFDVRAYPSAAQAEEVVRAFDGLALGGEVELLSHCDPRPFLRCLQVQRAGQFDWNVLGRDAAGTRVAIVRRRVPGGRTISESLQTDHRRLDALATDAEAALAQGDRGTACRRFAEFRFGLERHIDIEEFVLFPVFVRVTGMTQGPTDVMRDEHQQVRRHLDVASRALAAGDFEAFAQSQRAMKAVLVEHNMKEEHVFYPATDDGLETDGARSRLIEEMQAF